MYKNVLIKSSFVANERFRSAFEKLESKDIHAYNNDNNNINNSHNLYSAFNTGNV